MEGDVILFYGFCTTCNRPRRLFHVGNRPLRAISSLDERRSDDVVECCRRGCGSRRYPVQYSVRSRAMPFWKNNSSTNAASTSWSRRLWARTSVPFSTAFNPPRTDSISKSALTARPINQTAASPLWPGVRTYSTLERPVCLRAATRTVLR